MLSEVSIRQNDTIAKNNHLPPGFSLDSGGCFMPQ